MFRALSWSFLIYAISSSPLFGLFNREPVCAANLANNTLVDVFFDGNIDDALRSVQNAFNRLDFDKNGTVSTAEIKHHFSSDTTIDAKNKKFGFSIGNIIKFADMDGDQAVTLDEFKSQATTLFAHNFTYCSTKCSSLSEKLSSCGFKTDAPSSSPTESQAQFMVKLCHLISPDSPSSSFNQFTECVTSRDCSEIHLCFKAYVNLESKFIRRLPPYFSSHLFGLLETDADVNTTTEAEDRIQFKVHNLEPSINLRVFFLVLAIFWFILPVLMITSSIFFLTLLAGTAVPLVTTLTASLGFLSNVSLFLLILSLFPDIDGRMMRIYGPNAPVIDV